MLSVICANVVYTECRKRALYAECRYIECHYAECRYAECRGAMAMILNKERLTKNRRSDDTCISE